MKWFIITTLALVLFGACTKDDPDQVFPTQGALHYDGENLSAPILARGVTYPAVRFPKRTVESGGFAGRNIVEVEYYVEQAPEALGLLIFDINPVDSLVPGNLLYRNDMDVRNIRTGGWNRHLLDMAIPLPAEGCWIAFEVQVGDRDLAVIGCDPGPGVPDGNRYGILGNNNPGWITFLSFSSETVDINWNIRAVID